MAYLSSHTSSRRLPLKMLVTMKRQPLEVGLPADPAASIEGDRPGAVLWMAATLEEAANEGDGTWSEFALVARDLVGAKPVDTIPLARRIAAATVEAFEER